MKYNQLQTLNNEIQDCVSCNLCYHSRKVIGNGNINAKIMIVGEAPGKEEEETGIPFIGESGKKLTDTLNLFGKLRGQYYITNVLKCRPPKNRTPEENEVFLCRKFLSKEIKIIQPEKILLLGNTAMKCFLEEDGITRKRGQITLWRNIKVMPTFHPSYVLESRGNFKEENLFKQDIQKFL